MDNFQINIRIVFIAIIIICLLGSAIIAPALYDNVEGGTYHITQSPFSGEITSRMATGPYFQGFSKIWEFPVSETVFFTSDNENENKENKDGKDMSIAVQFKDGSICKISGTCRIDLPTDPQKAKDLVIKHGFLNQKMIEERLILQVLRNGLLAAANQMTAKESYADRRMDFISVARDQILNGVWKTKDIEIKDIDPYTKLEVVVGTKKVPITDEHGIILREPNPLDGTGISLSQFTIKSFVYEDKVNKQIEEQQVALMAVQTSKAKLLKADQDRLTAEADGKAKVMTAQYEEEQKKIRATVEADKEKEVAIISAQKFVEVATKEKEQALIAAQKEKEVAALQLDAAKLVKEQKIALGQGEAEAKKLIFEADGALQVKAETLVKINQVWADAFKQRSVPSIVMGSKDGAGTDGDAQNFMKLLEIKAAKDLSADMTLPARTNGTK